MKILVSSIVDLKKSQHNRPHQFVRHLSKNHDVTVISINDWWKGGQDNLDDYSKELDSYVGDIRYIYLTNKKISPVLQEVLFIKKVRQVAKEGFDVHLNYSTLVSGYIASHYIRTVYDVADDLTAMIKESPQIPRILRPFGGMLGTKMVKENIKKSNVITVTTGNLIESCDIPNEKCNIISNGVDATLFKYHRNAKEGLGIDGFIVGYVGVLREWVDFKPVFMALKKLNPTIKMLIVGKEGKYEETIQLARKCGVSERVIFTGMVPYSKVPLYVSAMDVCIIPFNKSAISENALPLKLFEYMACQKPVISSELLGVKNAVNDLVMYANSEIEYFDQITELYNDSQLRVEMGNAGRQFVESTYDWNIIANQLEQVLMETIKR